MIRHGESHLVEGIKMFHEKLDASLEELTGALPSEKRVEILEMENDALRYEEGQELIRDPSEAHPDLVWDFIEQENEYSLIIDVLEAREDEYIHLYDGTIHTIVKLHPTVSG